MKNLHKIGLIATFVILMILGPKTRILSQSFTPPIPVEVFFGHNSIYSQTVVKRSFSPESKFSFFGLATYTADYQNDHHENRMIMINQVSYNLGKGFGIMGGIDMNSVVGFSPIVGPQHNYASRKFLAVTVLSYFLNEDSDLKLFGLYEYTPEINENWSMYNRIQFIYNQSLAEGSHNISYLYLRTGLQKRSFIFGLAANIDQAGPQRRFGDNYGLFVRWEFK